MLSTRHARQSVGERDETGRRVGTPELGVTDHVFSGVERSLDDARRIPRGAHAIDGVVNRAGPACHVQVGRQAANRLLEQAPISREILDDRETRIDERHEHRDIGRDLTEHGANRFTERAERHRPRATACRSPRRRAGRPAAAPVTHAIPRCSSRDQPRDDWNQGYELLVSMGESAVSEESCLRLLRRHCGHAKA